MQAFEARIKEPIGELLGDRWKGADLTSESLLALAEIGFDSLRWMTLLAHFDGESPLDFDVAMSRPRATSIEELMQPCAELRSNREILRGSESSRSEGSAS